MQQQDNIMVGVERELALAPLRIWIVGSLDVVQPLVWHGAQVHALDSIDALYRELAIVPCDIVLIDTSQIREDVARTVAHLRRRDDLGVVLLVDPATPEAVAEGLWAGADACLPQRPSSNVLAAKLYSLRRRLPGEPAQVVEASAARLPEQGWMLESDAWDLRAPGGSLLALTEAERAFLSLLFSSPSETVARERLIEALTDQPWSFDPHRIEVLVHRLRNRVRMATGHTLPIRAVRGSGYRLTV
ncbi:response regulator transcription factor [Stenotrophomonas sp. STM01]|uniref:winged helix-turn-helix domain-containing protein n=1 Tax=Stenotrophomonas sp. STM01 TaxID=2769278 RepID=UPI0017831B61|nr:winged helix-turn-helix domain-containing protein [Stenotrophomonas sp. STM01]MBD9536081.1 response regulator transcription factor [Stenotrophomonas sp. STM01]